MLLRLYWMKSVWNKFQVTQQYPSCVLVVTENSVSSEWAASEQLVSSNWIISPFTVDKHSASSFCPDQRSYRSFPGSWRQNQKAAYRPFEPWLHTTDWLLAHSWPTANRLLTDGWLTPDRQLTACRPIADAVLIECSRAAQALQTCWLCGRCQRFT